MAGLYKKALIILTAFLVSACTGGSWNNPYPDGDASQSILYSAFSERPKHLDPVRAYSSNEYSFIAQIYEPLLQYHFLDRPYRLEPLAAARMPQVYYLNAAGERIAEQAEPGEIAYSDYWIDIKPGMRYQPHPALARDEQGEFSYHSLTSQQIDAANVLTDFPVTGTREVTAADFYHQIKRLAFPRLNSPIAGVMGDYIVGFSEFGKRVAEQYKTQQQEGAESSYFDLRQHEMEGVEVIDRYRLRIRLKGKYPQFLYWLAMPFFSPMPWEADAFYSQPGLEKRNISLNWYPLGSGPYMLEENNPNLRMILAENPNFHGESYPTTGEPDDERRGLLQSSGEPLPLIKRAIYSLEKESIPYWSKFLQGYYDTSGISSDSFDQAIQFSSQGEIGLTDEMAQKGITLHTAVTTSIFYFGFNMLDSTVGGSTESSRLLRQAISIALDFEEYISIFSNGRGVAAQGPLPPGIFGSRSGAEGVNGYVYDPGDGSQPQRKPIEAAKALMRQAGYPDGRDLKTNKPLILYYDTTATGPDGKARLNWMRKQFAKLGVQLVIRSSDYNRFQDKMREGTGQMYMWGWNADYPDPENFLFLLYGPNGKVEHAGENSSNYRNEEFDRLFVQMKNMENSDERLAIIDRMLEILRHDAPWAWGYFPKAYSLSHAWYGNVKPNLMANNTLKYKSIDPQLRETQRELWNPPVVWPLGLVAAVLLVTVVPAIRMYRQRERSAAR
ncbi:MAG: ABC transporter substrate-binding protein [Gammaproteobacteria bacterium]|nr:ABC transporter substrate-binding protein [Gammaproteobacteria bacterium]